MKFLNLAIGAILALGSMTAAPAAQTYMAQTTVHLNMRTGPGVSHRIVTTIPAQAPVHVHRCIPAPAWCEVSYGHLTGWSAQRYITSRHHHYHAHPYPPVHLIHAASTFGRPFRIVYVPVGTRITHSYHGYPLHW